MSKAIKLPKEVFVAYSYEDDPPFLMAFDDLVEASEWAGEEIEIGSYSLESSAKYTVDKTVTEL